MSINKKQHNETKQKPVNGLHAWWINLKHTRKNIKIVQGSPYARLVLGLKIRKIILAPLIAFILFMGFKMIRDYNANGLMLTIGRLVMAGIFIYLVYKIYSTIPAAKKEIEYYKKYPHLINYCPTNTKENVNDIIKKIKENKMKKDANEKKKEVKK
jgi:hypothetical protein